MEKVQKISEKTPEGSKLPTTPKAEVLKREQPEGEGAKLEVPKVRPQATPNKDAVNMQSPLNIHVNSAVLHAEYGSTEYQIAECMEIVKNSVIDLHRKDRLNDQKEYDRLRHEMEEMRLEMELMKKFMSREQLE